MTTRPHRNRRDGGETLIELLITIVILGVGVTAILGAVRIGVSSAAYNRNLAQVQSSLRSWAETLTATTDTSTYHYTPCASTANFPLPASSLYPPGFSPSVTSVSYWTGSVWSTSCGTDQGVQKVRLSMGAPGVIYPGMTQYLDIVVRRPCSTTAAAASC